LPSAQSRRDTISVDEKHIIAIRPVLQLPGGFLIGYPIGTAIAGGNANWTLAAVGAGLLVVAIPLISGYNKHAINAVNIYNRGLRSSINPASSLNLRFTANGAGLRISF